MGGRAAVIALDHDAPLVGLVNDDSDLGWGVLSAFKRSV